MSVSFIGFVSLDSTLKFPVQTANTSEVPTAPAATPTFRVYGQTGLMTNGTGTATVKETGNVTGATNASPIVITATNHGLSSGMRVTIASVGGNTAANGTFAITVVNANSFSLDSSTGNGSYTSGGTWTTTGLYDVSVTPTAANGFASGGWYDALVQYVVGGNTIVKVFRFGVL